MAATARDRARARTRERQRLAAIKRVLARAARFASILVEASTFQMSPIVCILKAAMRAFAACRRHNKRAIFTFACL